MPKPFENKFRLKRSVQPIPTQGQKFKQSEKQILTLDDAREAMPQLEVISLDMNLLGDESNVCLILDMYRFSVNNSGIVALGGRDLATASVDEKTLSIKKVANKRIPGTLGLN